MMMSYWDGVWTMPVLRADEQAGQWTKHRAFCEFAWRMDTLLLNWAQVTQRPEGGTSNDK